MNTKTYLKIRRSCWSSESPAKIACLVTSSATNQKETKLLVLAISKIELKPVQLKEKILYQKCSQQTTYPLQLSNGLLQEEPPELYTTELKSVAKEIMGVKTS